MLDNYYDSYGYKTPEHFITTADIKKVKFAPATRVERHLTEVQSFFSETGQETGALSQSPLLLKPIPVPPHDYSKDYLTFEALEDGNIYFTFNSSVTGDLLRSISYSLDGGETWVKEENPYQTQSSQAVNGKFLMAESDVVENIFEEKDNVEVEFFDSIECDDFTVAIASVDDEEDCGTGWSELYGKKSENGLVTIPVSSGDTILWKGDADTYAVMNSSNVPVYTHFGSDCKFNVYGNIMSLCYEDGFNGKKEMTHECQFAALFRDASGCHIVDASNLSLPATKLTESCYRTFLYGCSDLVSGPKLPATELAPNCYKSFYYNCTSLKNVHDLLDVKLYYRSCQYMFYNCKSLTKAPKLPSKNLGESCYEYMFSGCSSLTKTPDLPATRLSMACYFMMFDRCASLIHVPEKIECDVVPASACAGMFQACTSLKYTPELPSKNLGEHCYRAMFWNCRSLVKAPKLPAKNIAKYCYNSMFGGCSSLTKSPELPSKELSELCYYCMFSGCTSLSAVGEMSFSDTAISACGFMFASCESLTNVQDLNAMNLSTNCYLSMFDRCKSLIKAPKLPATTLADYCYMQMFRGCKSLIKAPKLPATELKVQCYSNIFSGCTSLSTAPELPATTLGRWCYSHMFEYCKMLVSAPELPATTLEENCYRTMFANCTNLNYIKCLAGAIEPTNAFTSWVSGVSSTGTFVKKAGVEWPSGANGIPTGWTVEEMSN